MKYETSVVYLEQLPKINVDTGFDLATFLSFAVTIVIFGIGAWLAIRSGDRYAIEQRRIFEETINQNSSLEKTLNSQEWIARQGAIKVSRQEWINALRDSCARFVSLALTINNHGQMKDATTDLARDLSVKGLPDGASLVVAWSNKATDLRSQVYDLKFRIELLSNTTEDLFVQLVDHVNSVASMCENGKAVDVYIECGKVKEVAQKILKIEWDKTRNMQ